MEDKTGRGKLTKVTPEEEQAMIALYLHTSMKVLDIAKLFRRDRRTLYSVINKHAKPNRKPWFCNYSNHPTAFQRQLREAAQALYEENIERAKRELGEGGDKHDD